MVGLLLGVSVGSRVASTRLSRIYWFWLARLVLSNSFGFGIGPKDRRGRVLEGALLAGQTPVGTDDSPLPHAELVGDFGPAQAILVAEADHFVPPENLPWPTDGLA